MATIVACRSIFPRTVFNFVHGRCAPSIFPFSVVTRTEKTHTQTFNWISQRSNMAFEWAEETQLASCIYFTQWRCGVWRTQLFGRKLICGAMVDARLRFILFFETQLHPHRRNEIRSLREEKSKLNAVPLFGITKNRAAIGFGRVALW